MVLIVSTEFSFILSFISLYARSEVYTNCYIVKTNGRKFAGSKTSLTNSVRTTGAHIGTHSTCALYNQFAMCTTMAFTVWYEMVLVLTVAQLFVYIEWCHSTLLECIVRYQKAHIQNNG